jgi:FixJ family two-component response regulator
LLRQSGLHAVSFLSAEDFLDDPLRAHFRCLLVDIGLGGMSGIELHQRLIAEGIRIPVIYITAYDDPEGRAQALSEGCAGFFSKTDAGPEIIEAIRRAISMTEQPGDGH